MKKILFLVFLLFSFTVVDPITIHSCKDKIIQHSYYTVCYNEKYRIPDWVSYKLTAEMLSSKVCVRKNNFRADTLDYNFSNDLADYEKSGYDRGHLCPAEDMRFSIQAESETFYMTNMTPQLAGFNRGIWGSLEDKVRDYATKYGEIYITSGSIIQDGYKTIGKDKVVVPQSFFKVVIVINNNDAKGIAFILKNESSTNDLSTFVTTIDNVEKITGIDFYPALPDNIENEIESTSDYSKW